MNQNINWTESRIKEENGFKTWNLFIKPSFMDTSKTEFPEGILLHFEGQLIDEELIKAQSSVKHFLNSMINDYNNFLINEPEYFDCKNFNADIQESTSHKHHHWTMISWDVPENADNLKLKAYIRLTPDFCDIEAAGYSFGLSVTDNFFDSEEDALSSRIKIERFMNQMLIDYKKII
jgi:hypothetical protein